MEAKKLFEYKGPVSDEYNPLRFDWRAVTQAATRRKALANLAYRFKKETGMDPTCKIFLTGDLHEMKT